METRENLASGFLFTLLASLGGEEAYSQSPLRSKWGGAFEAIVFDRGRLSKVGRQMHLYFEARIERDHLTVWWHPFFRTVNYWNDVALVGAVHYERLSDGLLAGVRNDIFLVLPPGADYQEAESFELKSPHDYDTVLAFVVEPKSQDVLTNAVRGYRPISLSEIEPGRTRVEFDQNYVGGICQFLSSYWKRPVSFGGILESSIS
jgi:hypothetical protein